MDAALWLREVATREALADKTVFALEVCLEELVTNIVRHGGATTWDSGSETIAPDMDALQIRVSLLIDAQGVDLIVEDNGRPFDVSLATGRPISGDIENVNPGGLGVQLIRSFSDELLYEPLHGGNRAIVKFLRQPEGASKAAV